MLAKAPSDQGQGEGPQEPCTAQAGPQFIGSSRDLPTGKGPTAFLAQA